MGGNRCGGVSCDGLGETKPLSQDEQLEALDSLLEALRAHPERARELAIVLRLAADK